MANVIAIDLSTKHVPPDFRKEFGTAAGDRPGPRFVEHEYGWVVFVTPSINRNEVASWLRYIHDVAIETDAVLINFDGDASCDHRFATYEG